MHMYTGMYINLHTYVDVYIYISAYKYTHMCRYIYIYIHIYMYFIYVKFIYTHICISVLEALSSSLRGPRWKGGPAPARGPSWPLRRPRAPGLARPGSTGSC